jgi:hypothetical protein
VRLPVLRKPSWKIRIAEANQLIQSSSNNAQLVGFIEQMVCWGEWVVFDVLLFYSGRFLVRLNIPERDLFNSNPVITLVKSR